MQSEKMKLIEEGIRLSVLQDKKKMLINMDKQKSTVKKQRRIRIGVWLSAAAAVTIFCIYMMIPGLLGTTSNTFADNIGHVDSKVSILRATGKSEVEKATQQAYSTYAFNEEVEVDKEIEIDIYKYAIPKFEKLISLEDNASKHRFFLALCYAYTNDTEKAIELFLSIEDSIDPQELPFYYSLGLAYFVNENYVEAKTLLLKHRSLSPDDRSDNVTKLLKDIEVKKK